MKRTHFVLLIVLSALVAIWFITDWVDESRENTFDTDFPELNLDEIDTLKIYAKAEEGREVTIYHNGEEWRVVKNSIDAPLHDGRIDILFTEFQNLKPTRLAGISKDDWDELGVTETSGTRVVAISDKGVELDLMVGEFQYHDSRNRSVERAPPGSPGKRGITHVRLTDQERVYSAEGFFGPNFNQQFETWRNQLIVNINVEELSHITFIYPENSTFRIDASGEDWYYGDEQINKQSQQQYASLLYMKKHTYFADAFVADRDPLFQVKYALKTGEEIVLDAFEANSGQIIIRSSQNPETFFLDHDDGILNSYFPPLDFFFDPNTDFTSQFGR